MADTGANLMSVNGVHQSFGIGEDVVEVLKGIDFAINEGTFNIIFGQSGSGKSTLLNILTGLQPPTQGTILFNGKNIYDQNADELARYRSHRIGIVYQQNYWVQSLTVRENVALPLYFRGYTKQMASMMADIALERVEMTQYADRTPLLLSGGEQQRVGMARALANDPMIVIADEPTGNLDSSNGDKIMDLLHRLTSEMRRTVILVTHNLEYLPLADNLLHIQDGAMQNLKHDTPQGMAEDMLEEMRTRLKRMIKPAAAKDLQ